MGVRQWRGVGGGYCQLTPMTGSITAVSVSFSTSFQSSTNATLLFDGPFSRRHFARHALASIGFLSSFLIWDVIKSICLSNSTFEALIWDIRMIVICSGICQQSSARRAILAGKRLVAFSALPRVPPQAPLVPMCSPSPIRLLRSLREHHGAKPGKFRSRLNSMITKAVISPSTTCT